MAVAAAANHASPRTGFARAMSFEGRRHKCMLSRIEMAGDRLRGSRLPGPDPLRGPACVFAWHKDTCADVRAEQKPRDVSWWIVVQTQTTDLAPPHGSGETNLMLAFVHARPSLSPDTGASTSFQRCGSVWVKPVDEL